MIIFVVAITDDLRSMLLPKMVDKKNIVVADDPGGLLLRDCVVVDLLALQLPTDRVRNDFVPVNFSPEKKKSHDIGTF